MADDEKISECCGAPNLLPIDDDYGLCERCKDWAGFVDPEEFERRFEQE